MRIKKPPKIELNDAIREILNNYPDHLNKYLELNNVIDDQGRYLPYDKLQFRVNKELDPKLVWGFIKTARKDRAIKLFLLGDDKQNASFVLTPYIQKALSETDRNATTAVLQWMTNNIGESHYLKYLLEDLLEDESISSSQLEGAVTTTLDAKRMIKTKQKPRTMDEKMVIGNYHMMQFVWKHRNKPLTVDFIKELHQVGVKDIDDKKYSPGEFRSNQDNVCVVDYDGNIVHNPPDAKHLESRLQTIIEWVNKCHDDANSRHYIHPLIKATILHFCIGYEHPFKDGNGRVARALFYWYMFKNNYAAFRYIAISTLLKAAPKQYGLSYIYSETDEMDLTYFIEYQCKIIIRGIQRFKSSYEDAIKHIQEFDTWIVTSGLFGRLNERQRTIFSVAKSKIVPYFTATSVSEILGCSYNTARAALDELVKLKIFKTQKEKKETIYSMRSLKSIQEEFDIA